MFSGLIIFELSLSFIVTENCPGAMTGDAQIFEVSDGCMANLREPEKVEKHDTGCGRRADNFPLVRLVVLEVISEQHNALACSE